MDRLFAEQCRIEAVKLPKGLTGVDFTYRVCGNELYPAVAEGDIVCCTDTPAPILGASSLIVVHFHCGYKKLIRYKPLRTPVAWAAAVKFIIKN